MNHYRHLRAWVLACFAWLLLPAFAALDANQAPADDLMTLKGVGPRTSARIVEARQAGPFRDWPDLIRRVQGIGPATAAKLSSQGLRIHGLAYDAPDTGPAAAPVSEWRPMVPRPLEPVRHAR